MPAQGIKGVRRRNLSEYGIKNAVNQASLLILPTENGFDAVQRQTPPRYIIRSRWVIAQTQPS
ncbi:hypothetical protein BG74_02170 [Sodalis-like endosymbiont of Proechinophthirus fluctus]|nr:hypothetical protein BG74_02170 [Sodalis-like endosymbiont of Proechinophthirus fluctus]